MIFVTVGTQQNKFDRLFKYLDCLDIKEAIVVQKGKSKYLFEKDNIISKSYYSYEEMTSLMNSARVVVTHGGPGTIFQALELNKKVIVVPRLQRYHEIVADDHQYEFCKYLKSQNYCMVAENYDEFYEALKSINKKKFNKYTSDIGYFKDNIEKEIKILLED